MQRISNYIDKDLNESRFQEAQKVGDLDTMWECVSIACYNMAKSIYKKRGFFASEDDLYDVSMNATMMCMRNVLERNIKIDKLSSYVYTRVFCYVQGYQQDKLSRKLKDIISNNMDVSSYIGEIYYE